jgi:guanylate kinase
VHYFFSTLKGGAGKTTIVQYLLREIPELAFSISACSREPRGREIPGVDYHYFSVEEFRKKIAAKRICRMARSVSE